MSDTFSPEFCRALLLSLDNAALLLRREEDGRYYPLRCSRKFAAAMECSEERFCEMEHSAPLGTIFPEDRETIAKILRDGRMPGQDDRVAVRILTAKGNVAWLDMTVSFFSFEGSDYVYCSCFDFTHIKENEAQLVAMYQGMHSELNADSEEMLAVFRVNLTRDFIEQRGGKDIVPELNEPVYSKSVKARADAYPLSADRKRFLETFDRENLIENFEKGKTRDSVILFTKRLSGRSCFVQGAYSLIRHPATGDLIAFITEKEYNREIVHETILRKVLEKQHDFVAYLTDGCFHTVAKTLTDGRHILIPEQERGDYRAYIEEQVIPLLAGDDEQRGKISEALSLERVEAALDRREPYRVNLTCRVDGELYYQQFSFYRAESDVKFYILLKSDYTEIQREQLRVNEQLENALRESHQASIAKTAFLSRMSHEIRTPMNTIIGLDTIGLQEEGISPQMRAILEKIGGSAKYLLSLINDILDMSRIESGSTTIRSEEFSFKDFLDQINTILYTQCREKGLRYECFIHGSVGEHYIGDAQQLQQVLINILGNAVKFTDKGGTICFHVECVNQTDTHSTLRFVVEDTGIGMDAEYLPHLFEPFSQEDSGNTNIYGGSGLGLAISKHIIEMMNGSIDVKSEKGQGSVFTVEVMLHNVKHTDSESASDLRMDPRDFRVLVIDDDETACRHAQIVLGEAGFQADTCMTQEEALRLVKLHHARNEGYHLILVDLRMPQTDGIVVTRSIREVIGEDATIIILTAYSWDEVEKEAVEAGVDGFMRKPLFGESIVHEFKQALYRKRLKTKRETDDQGLKDRRILLAEDVEINAEIVKRLLTIRGAQVDIAENGEAAVRRFQESAPGYYDAVLMDVRMPVMDGLEATAAIRALDRADARTVPIIAMTANAFDEDVERSLHAGMNAHLSKPVEPQHLYETLEKYIANEEEKRT